MIEDLNNEARADIEQILSESQREILEIAKPAMNYITRPAPGFGLTSTEFAEGAKCSEDHARHVLHNLHKQGKLERKRIVREGGGTEYLYYKPGAWPE